MTSSAGKCVINEMVPNLPESNHNAESSQRERNGMMKLPLNLLSNKTSFILDTGFLRLFGTEAHFQVAIKTVITLAHAVICLIRRCRSGETFQAFEDTCSWSELCTHVQTLYTQKAFAIG